MRKKKGIFANFSPNLIETFLTQKFVELLLSIYLLMLVILSFRVVGGYHSFRQSQSNFPIILWKDSGFSPFKPVVPFIGQHSTWLLEFPIFQWIGYFASLIVPIKVDFIMRLLSLSFALGSGYLLTGFRSKSTNRALILLIATASPYFLYWSTTGLCDWLALFLSIFGVNAFKNHCHAKGARSRIFLVLCFVSVGISGLVKLPLCLFGLLLGLITWSFYVRNLPWKSLNFLIFYSIAGATVFFALLWSHWENNLYPLGDPRHLWATSSDNFKWYFGSNIEYRNLVKNVFQIIKSLLSTTNLVFYFFIGVVLLMRKRTRFYLMVLLALGIGYTAVFINLNLVHTYYQIPQIYVALAAFMFALDSKEKIFKKKNISTKSFMLVWSLGIILTLVNQQSIGYLKNTFTRNGDINYCPKANYVTGPVLGINVPTGPAMFYECKLKGFDVFTNSADQVSAVLKEKTLYRYAFAQDDANLIQLKNFLKMNNGRAVREISPNWFEIGWN